MANFHRWSDLHAIVCLFLQRASRAAPAMLSTGLSPRSRSRAALHGLSISMFKILTNQEANRRGQRTVRLSLFTIVGLACAGIGFGLFIGSKAVMLDGSFY